MVDPPLLRSPALLLLPQRREVHTPAAPIRYRGRREKKEANTMLFVALLRTRPGTSFQEGGARRLQWQYPEGLNVLAEFWLETESPRVVAIMEADSMAPFGEIRMVWGDLFDIEVFPAVTAEQGMEMLGQSMSEQQA